MNRTPFVGEQPKGGERQLRRAEEEPPGAHRVQVHAQVRRHLPLRDQGTSMPCGY